MPLRVVAVAAEGFFVGLLVGDWPPTLPFLEGLDVEPMLFLPAGYILL